MTAGRGSEDVGRADAHPDLETLAELQEDVLDPARERRVRRHVGTCDECTAALAKLDTTRLALANLPPVTLPDDVAARLDDALADAGSVAADAGPAAEAGSSPATTIVPPPGRTPWWRGGAFAGTAAAAAVVLLVAGVIAGAIHSSRSGSNSDTGSSTSADKAAGTGGVRTFSATASGRDYTAKTLAAALPALLGTPAPVPSGSAFASEGGAGGGSAAGTRNGAPAPALAAPRTTALQPLAQPQKLADCIAALIGRPAGAVTPLAVDLAEYEGEPAAVIVLPSANRPTLVDIWVVGPGCGPADQQFKFFLRAPRPS